MERDGVIQLERPYFRLGHKHLQMNSGFSPLFATVVLTGQGHLVKSSMLSITAMVILPSSLGKEIVHCRCQGKTCSSRYRCHLSKAKGHRTHAGSRWRARR